MTAMENDVKNTPAYPQSGTSPEKWEQLARLRIAAIHPDVAKGSLLDHEFSALKINDVNYIFPPNALEDVCTALMEMANVLIPAKHVNENSNTDNIKDGAE